MPRLTVQPPEWIDSAPAVATSSTEISAPPSAVWARLVDHESWTEWFTDLKQVEPVGSADGVGGQRTVKAGVITLEEEFTAWIENEHFAFAVTKSPIPVLATLAESVTIKEIANGSRVVYRQGVEGRRGFGWLAQRVARQLEQQTGDALTNLKSLIENATP